MVEFFDAAEARERTLNAGKDEEQNYVLEEITKATSEGKYEILIKTISDEIIETLRELGYVVQTVPDYGTVISWDYIAPNYVAVTTSAEVTELLAGTDPVVYATIDSDIDFTSGYVSVPEGKELNVTIAEGATMTCAKAAFVVYDGGSLTLKGGGSIVATESGSNAVLEAIGADAKIIIDGVTVDVTGVGENVSNYGVYLQNGASIEVKSGAIKVSAAHCIATNNTTGGGNITIRGGELYSESYALYIPSQSTVEITGGIVQGIEARMGRILIHGDAEIINTEQTAENYENIGYYVDRNGSISVGDTITILAGAYSDTSGTDCYVRVYEDATVASEFKAAIGVYKLDTKEAQNVTVSVANKANVTTTDNISAIKVYDHDYILEQATEQGKTYSPVADSSVTVS